jgi:hypothetical protein
MKKSEVNTKEDLEDYYNTCRKIKFRNDTEVPKSIRSILKRILDYQDGESEATVFSREGHHCHKDKSRSLDDIIRLCKYYFPKHTVKQVIKGILDYQKTFANNFYFEWCPNIRKVNFRGWTYWKDNGFGKKYNSGLFTVQGFPNCKISVLDYID